MQDVLDDQGHRMALKFTYVSSTMQTQDKDVLYCALCLDEIDKVLGYFYCPICKTETCRECSVNANRMDLEIAENPILVPTPLTDL
jgi:hypothetical protein